MNKKNILVTGCGGDIGFGLGKILKQQNFVSKIIGTDINLDIPAKVHYVEVFKLPKVNEDNYLSSLKQLVIDNNIDLIMPSSEPEIRFFANKKLRSINNVPLILPNQESMDIFFDKFKTYEFLRNNNLPYPWTIKAEGTSPFEMPCILKENNGCGSKNIHIVTNENINECLQNTKGMIWQELLLPDNEEYTCGLYRTEDCEVRTIIFKRTLQGDHTGKGIVVENEEIKKVLIKIADKINLKGSINVQLRLTKRGPVVFEINPRFSSTVVFRDMFGFNDCVWAIKEVLGEKAAPLVDIKPNQKFYKIFDEIII